MTAPYCLVDFNQTRLENFIIVCIQTMNRYVEGDHLAVENNPLPEGRINLRSSPTHFFIMTQNSSGKFLSAVIEQTSEIYCRVPDA